MKEGRRRRSGRASEALVFILNFNIELYRALMWKCVAGVAKPSVMESL